MSFLIIDRERYALQLGETTLGGDADELLAQSSLAQLPPFAVISSGSDDEVMIRALPGAIPAKLGGRLLTTTPRPIRHGDRLEVSGKVLLYGDLSAAGRTDAVPGVTDDEAMLLGDLAPADATAPTGGRLIALASGERHDVPDSGLVIGRDPECGVVIRSSSVSRRHASIAPGLLGYTITDESTNGVLVNGTRIVASALLRQGDRVRIGDAEFRFEADQAVYEPPPSLGAGESSLATPPRSEPVMRPAATLLATLEVLTRGLQEGKRFRLEKPVAQLGRGTHNDVHLADDSVSGSHATLVRRGATWHLLDLGSRNGTYVDGVRVTDQALTNVCELRIGNVKLLFRAINPAAADEQSTRGIVGLTDEQLNRSR
jgi:pSer/pThr/pTyr-binding forkhead associated (FHA) protein